ncbi:MAG: hypothetical protein NZ739_00330 [Verrucomicrobiae bacterium]|nr:hypothetical protein [Verrucomicrobiae bacterium]MCX7723518.1 hypothetical protein [Verrucomicrobiae bacterium]MDW7979344.1 hypothetical protein [Verrucomicrobiales bacterium]
MKFLISFVSKRGPLPDSGRLFDGSIDTAYFDRGAAFGWSWFVTTVLLRLGLEPDARGAGTAIPFGSRGCAAISFVTHFGLFMAPSGWTCGTASGLELDAAF